MTLASLQRAPTPLWSCDTGTDLMVTYQRPLSSAPPTLRGPHLALYNRQQTLAKAQPVVHGEHGQSPTPNYKQA